MLAKKEEKNVVKGRKIRKEPGMGKESGED